MLGTAVVCRWPWCHSAGECQRWWTAMQYRWRTWISSGTL